MVNQPHTTKQLPYWLSFLMAVGIGFGFCILLIRTAWITESAKLENALKFETAIIEQRLKLYITASDDVIDSIKTLFNVLPPQSTSTLATFIDNVMLRQQWVQAIAHYRLTENGYRLNNAKYQRGVLKNQRLPEIINPQEQFTDVIKTAISSQLTIPVLIDDSKQILLFAATQTVDGHHNLLIVSTPVETLLTNVVIDPTLSITIQSDTGGLVGRQTLFSKPATHIAAFSLSDLEEQRFLSGASYSMRVNLIKKIFWRELAHSSFYIAALIGIAMTLLLIALVRAKERQANELAIRNAMIQKQVEEQTEELKYTRDQALAASKAKSDFLAIMSHEIRTPISAMVGSSELLDNSHLDDEQKQYVGIFKKAGDNLLTLVDNILDLSKIEAQQIILEHIQFDLRQLLEEAIDIYALKLTSREVDLACHIDTSVALIRTGDPARLRQIILNLIGNAAKFTAQGHIIVSVKNAATMPSKDALLISVEDTGIGIPTDKLDSVFASFTQADSSTTRQYGGTGLGLTISKKLAEIMGGYINVTSTEGSGSVFSVAVCLPAAAEQPLVAKVLTDHHVFIFEHSLHCNILAALLMQLGATVATVTDLDNAKKLLQQNQANNSSKYTLFFVRHDASELYTLLDTAKTIWLFSLSEMHNDHTIKSKQIRLIKPIKQQDVLQSIQTIYPATDKSLQTEHHSTQASNTMLAKHILLVDDNVDNRLLINAFLKGTPYRVDEAENGAEGVELFKKNHYDIVLMDVQMPVMDGHEATRQIRAWEKEQKRAPTSIISLTAHVIKEEIEKCIAAGSDAHLGRPVRKATLLQVLSDYPKYNNPIKIKPA